MLWLWRNGGPRFCIVALGSRKPKNALQIYFKASFFHMALAKDSSLHANNLSYHGKVTTEDGELTSTLELYCPVLA